MATLTITAVDVDTDTFTTSSPHGLISGDDVLLVADSAPGGLSNNTIYHARVIDSTNFKLHSTASQALTITAATCTANVATLTFASRPSAPFAVGSTVKVASITGVLAYNGSFIVTACNTTTVSYALAPTVTAGTTSGSPLPTVRDDTRSMARTGFNTIDITSAGSSVTFKTSDVNLQDFISLKSSVYGTPSTPAITSTPFEDFNTEQVYIADNSLLGLTSLNSVYQSLIPNQETSTHVSNSPIEDFFIEPKYLAHSSLLGAAQPTFVYANNTQNSNTSGEVWFLS